MQKLVREFIILSILLRCWLTKKWIQSKYLDALKTLFFSNANSLSSLDFIVRVYVMIIRSNCIVMSQIITVVDWFKMRWLIIKTHQELQLLMKAAVVASMKTSESREIFRSSSFSLSRSSSSSQTLRRQLNSSVIDNIISLDKKELEYDNMQKRSNMHNEVHLKEIVREYIIINNVNVLIEEEKHRWVI